MRSARSRFFDALTHTLTPRAGLCSLLVLTGRMLRLVTHPLYFRAGSREVIRKEIRSVYFLRVKSNALDHPEPETWTTKHGSHSHSLKQSHSHSLKQNQESKRILRIKLLNAVAKSQTQPIPSQIPRNYTESHVPKGSPHGCRSRRGPNSPTRQRQGHWIPRLCHFGPLLLGRCPWTHCDLSRRFGQERH